MNKSVKLSLVAATIATAFSVGIAAPAAASDGYVTSPSGEAVKDPFGLCWRSPSWTPANAIAGCDDDLLPKPAAPKPAVAPAPRPIPRAVPRPAPAPAPAPRAEKVTFAADAFFDFDKAVLKPEGKSSLDGVVSKLSGVALEVIIAVGHTDSIGPDRYNQRLSVRRAEAVKAYLVSKGIEANRVYTEGKGEKQPVASNKTKDGRAKNRRVEIEVVGTRQR
ncbi:MAG: OmpA family protein [Burkholderiaceae bacterium]|nr:OmpA family protein [Burkholderiaceae bacterium]